MRSGRVEAAAALAVKIGIAIKLYTSAELSRIDVLADARSMWAKVRQLTGRSKTTSNIGNNAAMTADALNEHYCCHIDRC